MFWLYSLWVRNVRFPPHWAEALSSWHRGEGAVGSDDICCSSVIVSPFVLPCQWHCELGGKDVAGRVNPLKKCGQSNLLVGFVESDHQASHRAECGGAHLASLPSLPSLAGLKDFAAPGQHTYLLHSLQWRLSHCQDEVGGWMHPEAIQTSRKLN